MKKKKISADITAEAKQLLDDLCDKHERSKGFLLEKMIRKFCGGEEAAPATQVAVVEKPKAKVKRFVRPTPFEIYEYMSAKGTYDQEQANKFYDFYESKGWVVGKNKMKCWKAAVRNWLKGNNNGKANSGASKKLSAFERMQEANSEYRQPQPDEREMGVGADGGHLGGAVDSGEGGITIDQMDRGTFIDYE